MTTSEETIMTTTALRTTDPTKDRPTGVAGALQPSGPRRHRRHVAIVGIVAGGLAAVTAVGTVVLLGQRATSTPAPAVGTSKTLPGGWQQYRAGERGDAAIAWTRYRAGERTTGTTTAVGSAVPVDWPVYRAGERGNTTAAPGSGDRTTYRTGERTTSFD